MSAEGTIPSAVADVAAGMLAEDFHGDTRAHPSPSDLALARFGRQLAERAFHGSYTVEVLHGGHAQIRGRSGMMPAQGIQALPEVRDFNWRTHYYTRPPTIQGSLEGPHGGSVHVHRQLDTPGREEDDSISLYFSHGAGRAAARKALEEAGFHDFV